MAFHGDSIYWVEVEKVVANPFQPRREFDEAKLKELADSIRMYGVLQPLTVTRKEIQRDDGTLYTEYELIAGERRLRASKLAGVAQVPVIIREGEQSEQEKLELAIIENLQREDLNAVDRALAFRQLADSFGLSHAQVAEKVGRSREYVSNTIRLLGLPEYILNALRQGDLSEGHARTLLMLSDKPEEQEVIFREIMLKKLSVREAERIIRKIATDRVRKKSPDEFDTELIEYEKQFTETLGTRVQIMKTDFGGKLTIDYFSVEDLEAMLQRMRDAALGTEPAATVDEAINALRGHTPLEMREQSVPPASTAEEDRLDTASSQRPAAPEPTTESPPAPTQATPPPAEPPHAAVAAETPPPPESTPVPPSMQPGGVEGPSAEPANEYPADAPPATSAPTPTAEVPTETVASTAHTASHEESSTPPAPADQPSKNEREDDAGLYSIRNFSV